MLAFAICPFLDLAKLSNESCPRKTEKNKEIQSFSDTNPYDRPAIVSFHQYSCFLANAANTAALQSCLSCSSLSSHHSTPANRLHSVTWKSEDAG